MREKKVGLTIKILILVIVILLGVIIYAFVIRPQITGYAINAYNQGYQYAILQIAQQATTCQPVPLTVGNQSINIIAIECLPQSQ